MNEKKISVLYLDDEVENLKNFKSIFRKDFTVYLAESVEEAFGIINRLEVNVIISEHKGPSLSGIDFFASLCLTHPNIKRVLLTENSDLSTVVDAVNKGQIFRFLYKPMDEVDIRKTIIYAFEAYLDDLESEQQVLQLLGYNERVQMMMG